MNLEDPGMQTQLFQNSVNTMFQIIQLTYVLGPFW